MRFRLFRVPSAFRISVNYPRVRCKFRLLREYYDGQHVVHVMEGESWEVTMNHRGIEFTVAKTAIPGVWQWQFRIGEQIKSGKTETKIDLLAIRRVQLRIDRELKAIGRKTA